MANKLVYYGNDTLKKVAQDVLNINGDLIKLVDSMFDVMYREKGIGLAAPQVDVSKRIIILDFEGYKGPVKTIINPVIKDVSNKRSFYEEGCLSLPGITKEIERPEQVLVAGITTDGDEVEFEAEGLLARVLQHEIDHLNGVVFIDHLEDYLRNELRPYLKKIKKLNKEK